MPSGNYNVDTAKISAQIKAQSESLEYLLSTMSKVRADLEELVGSNTSLYPVLFHWWRVAVLADLIQEMVDDFPEQAASSAPEYGLGAQGCREFLKLAMDYKETAPHKRSDVSLDRMAGHLCDQISAKVLRLSGREKLGEINRAILDLQRSAAASLRSLHESATRLQEFAAEQASEGVHSKYATRASSARTSANLWLGAAFLFFACCLFFVGKSAFSDQPLAYLGHIPENGATAYVVAMSLPRAVFAGVLILLGVLSWRTYHAHRHEEKSAHQKAEAARLIPELIHKLPRESPRRESLWEHLAQTATAAEESPFLSQARQQVQIGPIQSGLGTK